MNFLKIALPPRAAVVSAVVLCVVNLIFASSALAQGQDSTPAERDIMILGQMLPSLYDNSNQAYFDVCLKRPDAQRHQNIYNEVSRIQSKHFGN